MIIYIILPNGYFGGTQEVPDDEVGIPYGTTRTAVPEIPEGYYAVWNGTGWNLTQTPPPIEEPEPVIEETVQIPNIMVVSLRQAKRILFQYDLLTQVDSYIQSLPSPQKELTEIDWQYANEVRKDSLLVQQMASVLQLSPEQIDILFYEASLIE